MFCYNCGAKLEDDEKFCYNCGAPVRNLGMKFCEYCGTGVIEVNTRVWKFNSITEETKRRTAF